MIIKQIEITDQRHFDFARESVKRRAAGMIVAIICGSGIAVSGYASVVWLAVKGHDLAAAIVGLPITTVLAMVVGNRFLSRDEPFPSSSELFGLHRWLAVNCRCWRRVLSFMQTLRDEVD